MTKKKPSLPVSPSPLDPIQALAYELWQKANRPAGQDMDFWLQAERQSVAPPQAASAASVTAPRSAKSTPTAAKSNPQAALSFKPVPATPIKRSAKRPAR
jgi:hypothetical protein